MAHVVTGNWYACGSSLRATFYAKVRRVPDELLQRLVVILYKEETLGLFDNIAKVLQDCLAFGREVFIGVG